MCEIKDAVVLVIDDCEDNLFLLELVLAEDGYKVEKASCGQEGISKIHELIPELIILDMMMPDMTGFEVIEHIKLHHHLSHIPILICTANKYIQKEDIKEVENVCYKPIDLSDLLAQVNSLVACCDSVKNPTLIIDVNDQDPLCFDQKQLLSKFHNELLMLETLETKGYKIATK